MTSVISGAATSLALYSIELEYKNIQFDKLQSTIKDTIHPRWEVLYSEYCSIGACIMPIEQLVASLYEPFPKMKQIDASIIKSIKTFQRALDEYHKKAKETCALIETRCAIDLSKRISKFSNELTIKSELDLLCETGKIVIADADFQLEISQMKELVKKESNFLAYHVLEKAVNTLALVRLDLIVRQVSVLKILAPQPHSSSSSSSKTSTASQLKTTK